MTAVVVLVPARDEEAGIRPTLAGICDSLDAAERSGTVEAAAVLVVAHRCRDATAQVARAALHGRANARVVLDETSTTVGQVRDGAARRGLAELVTPAQDTWLLSTDADTDVGVDWVTQVIGQTRRSGAVAVAGLAPLDDWYGAPAAYAAYELLLASKMRSADPAALRQHDHVYGANLGVRADAYLAVGGFRHLGHGEDQALVDDLLASGRPVLRTRTVNVRTSGRMQGRARGGLASHLAHLDHALDG